MNENIVYSLDESHPHTHTHLFIIKEFIQFDPVHWKFSFF